MQIMTNQYFVSIRRNCINLTVFIAMLTLIDLASFCVKSISYMWRIFAPDKIMGVVQRYEISQQ